MIRKLSLLLVAVWTYPLFAAQPAQPPRRVEQLVPANFNSLKTDSMGFRWQIDANGRVNSGNDSCFSEGFVLQINNRNFSPNQQLMTADGSEYVLTGTSTGGSSSRGGGGLEVTRRIKVDAASATVRYVEIFRNPSPSATVNTTVMIVTGLGNNQYQSLISDSGAPEPTSLGKKDTGLVMYAAPNTGQLSVLFYLAGARSKVKPAIRIDSRTRFMITYPLTIGPGKTVAILHGGAKRGMQMPPDVKTAASLLAPFQVRRWTADLPADVRRAIVNLGRTAMEEWEPAASAVTLESLGIEPGTADVLAVGATTRLNGTATCKSLAVETRYGEARIPWEEVAAIAGVKHATRNPCVFLRDGQVFHGKLKIEKLQFAMNTGLVVDVAGETLDRLVLRAGPQDGKPSADAAAMLETVDGDRLALAEVAGQKVSANTPWGRREIPLEDVVRLAACEEPLGHRLALRDGSRLFAFLDDAPLKLKTLQFAAQQFTPMQIRALLAAQTDASPLDLTAMAVPYMVLSGDNLLVGQIDLPAVGFITAGQRIPVPPAQLRALRNSGADDADDGGGQETSLFEAELWDGGAIGGRLNAAVLPVRSGDLVCQIPIQYIVEVRVPAPAVPEPVRVKIAQYLRDLADPDYAKRKAAKTALTELGAMAKPQLSDALKDATDPEVRRTVQALIEELKE